VCGVNREGVAIWKKSEVPQSSGSSRRKGGSSPESPILGKKEHYHPAGGRGERKESEGGLLIKSDISLKERQGLLKLPWEGKKERVGKRERVVDMRFGIEERRGRYPSEQEFRC